MNFFAGCDEKQISCRSRRRAAIAIAASLLAGAQILPLPRWSRAFCAGWRFFSLPRTGPRAGSLTTWIFVGLLAALNLATIAFRRCQLASSRRDFSSLIKVIIAPLLSAFSSLASRATLI